MITINLYVKRLGRWIRESRGLIFKRKLNKSDLQLLQAKFPYYARLSSSHKKEFERKLEIILSTKEFVGRGGISMVTEEMELLIGATISMVTFGWKRVRLPHFQRILVYPNAYYSSITKTYHRGEVNPKFGIIAVSWNCFWEGLKDESDGINLGIHEVAHALKLENYIYSNEEVEFFNPVAKRKYISIMQEEMKNLKNGQSNLFRESAKLNEDEFFAVSLEYFFEKPEALFEAKPEFYKILVQLMQQDPRVVSPKIIK